MALPVEVDLGHACSSSQLLQIIQIIGLLDVHSFVRSPCGQNLYIESIICSQLLVPLQRINRIIGGADQGNIALLDQITNAHGRLLQFFVAQVPYFVSGVFVQNAIVTEVSL